MRKNKRGQILNTTTSLIVGIMVLVFIVFAILYGITALKPASFFDTSTAQNNASQIAVNSMTANLTNGIAQFSSYIPTVLVILGVVMAIAGIVLLIGFVRRMQGGGGGGL